MQHLATTPRTSDRPAATRMRDPPHGPAYLVRPAARGDPPRHRRAHARRSSRRRSRAQAEKGGRLGEVLVGAEGGQRRGRGQGARPRSWTCPTSRGSSPDEVDAELVKRMPINFAKQARILPLRLEGDAVALAVADPLDTTVLDHARMLLQRERLAPARARPHHRRRHQQRLRPRGERGRAARRTRWRRRTSTRSPTSWRSRRTSSTRDDEAPIIRLVNSLLFRAAKERASDIHIEPMERELLVRFRDRRRAAGDHQAAQALPELASSAA